jgi:hypothetical protein
MYRILQLCDFAIIVGVFFYLLGQPPSPKLTATRALLAGILAVGLSVVPPVVFPTSRWHGYGSWFSLSSESVGIGSTLLAMGYGVLAYAVFRALFGAETNSPE